MEIHFVSINSSHDKECVTITRSTILSSFEQPLMTQSCYSVINKFEEVCRSHATIYKCYRQWELQSISLSNQNQNHCLSWEDVQTNLQRFIEEKHVEPMILYLSMCPPKGFTTILNELDALMGQRSKTIAIASNEERYTMTLILDNSMRQHRLTLSMPISWESLIEAVNNVLGSLRLIPFELYADGNLITSETKLSTTVSDGGIIFYRTAHTNDVYSIGVLGFYKEFPNLLSNLVDFRSTENFIHIVIRFVLHSFGLHPPEDLIHRCMLNATKSHDFIQTLDLFESKMDLLVPDVLIIHLSVLSENDSLSLTSNSSHRVDVSSSVLSSPSSSHVQFSASPHSRENMDTILLLCDNSWSDHQRSISMKLFGRDDTKFDALDGVDIVDHRNQLLNGMVLLIRPSSIMINYRCFNYICGNMRPKAGSPIALSLFPLQTSVLFEQVRALYSIRPDWKFKLFVPVAENGRTEISETTRINAPKQGRVTKVYIEPETFVVVNLSIDPMSYAMLDDLLTGVPRACNHVSLSRDSLKDNVSCHRDILQLFELPSSVSIDRIYQSSALRPSDSVSRSDTPSSPYSGSQALIWDNSCEYIIVLRQAAPVELTNLSLQSNISEVILQELWTAHCSLEEIAWVLGLTSGNIRSHLTVDEAKREIYDRRERRIPNDLLLAVECQDTDGGRSFRIKPDNIIDYIFNTFGVRIYQTPNDCKAESSSWFFSCQTPETAEMLYHSAPAEITGANGSMDVVLFLAPSPDDAVYDIRPRSRRNVVDI